MYNFQGGFSSKDYNQEGSNHNDLSKSKLIGNLIQQISRKVFYNWSSHKKQSCFTDVPSGTYDLNLIKIASFSLKIVREPTEICCRRMTMDDTFPENVIL